MDTISPLTDTTITITTAEYNKWLAVFNSCKTKIDGLNQANFTEVINHCKAALDEIGTQLIAWLQAQGNHMGLDQLTIYVKYGELKLCVHGITRIQNNDRLVLKTLIEQSTNFINLQKSKNIPEYLRIGIGMSMSEGNVLTQYSSAATQKFKNLVGMETAKQRVLSIISPLNMALTTDARYQKLILYGPPGTGKTDFAKAIANEIGATFVMLTPADLLLPSLGASEKLLNNLVSAAKQSESKVVLFFDEMDNVFSRAPGTLEVNKSLTVQFLNIVNNQLPASVFIIGATNYLYLVDSAVRSRLNDIVYVGLPTLENLAKLFVLLLPGTTLKETQAIFNIPTVSGMLKNFSNRDMTFLVANIKKLQVAAAQQAQYFELATNYTYKGVWRTGLMPSLKTPTNGQIVALATTDVAKLESLTPEATSSTELYTIDESIRIDFADYMIPPSPFDFLAEATANIKPLSDAEIAVHSRTSFE
jgi:vacuolar protein-sorting-associated protein 4